MVLVVDDRIGQRIVVQPGGRWFKPGLRLVHLLGDAGSMPQLKPSTPLGVVRLQPLGLRRRGQHHGLRRPLPAAAEKNQQRHRSLRRAKHRPVGGPAPLQAGMDHVLRPVRLVGLRNQAAAPIELRSAIAAGRSGNELTGKMADQVRASTAPSTSNLARLVELSRARLRPNRRLRCQVCRSNRPPPQARARAASQRESSHCFHASVPQRLAGFQRKGDPLLRLALAARERNASRSRSSRYCSLTSVPAVTRPPARMYAAQRATFWSCSEA